MKAKNGIIPPGFRFNENGEIELSSAKCAEFFNVSDWTVRDWGSKGAPQVERGWWNLKEIVQWLGKGRPGEGEDLSDEARKLKAEANLKEQQALKTEFENDVLKGRYFPKEEVEKEWSTRIIEIKNFLLAFARKIGSLITDPDLRIELEKSISDEVYSALNQYSRAGKYTPNIKKKV
jgi:phage terminase Nu1 subunit (DNA packaging protein)